MNQMTEAKTVLGVRGGVVFYVVAFIVILFLCAIDSFLLPVNWQEAWATVPPGVPRTGPVTQAYGAYVPFPQCLISRTVNVFSSPLLLVPVALLFAAARLVSFKRRNNAVSFVAAVLSVIGFFIVAFWVAAPSRFRGTTFCGKSTAEMVTMLHPFHLVQPAWLNVEEGIPLLGAWRQAETSIRLVIVCVLWAVSLFLIYRLMGRKAANNDLQLTK